MDAGSPSMDMLQSPIASSSRKHKKHKSDRRERVSSSDECEKPGGLKLILKVSNQSTPEHYTDFQYYAGGSQSGSGDVEAASAYAKHHHKKSKKKKKKRKKERGRDRERKHKHGHKAKQRRRDDEDEEEHEQQQQQEEEDAAAVASISLKPAESCIGSPYREPRTCVIRKAQERSVLQRLLDHFLRQIEKKDPQQFFAWPVTDSIAPGYSAIISSPMDCSTMRQKIDDGEYRDLRALLDDFRLMCGNAMRYNHADTVYYKASRKLLHAGLKLAQPERCAWLLALVPEAGRAELGFDVPAEVREPPPPPATTPAKRRLPATKFEAIADDLEPEEVAARAVRAARDARAKLERRRGGPSMGFLRQRKDGSTHLSILVGGDGLIGSTRKRPVLLGEHTGRVAEGTGAMHGFREDRRNAAKPVRPLYYGAFGSYAPSYDSAFANLTKAESELVLATYGSDAAVQYAESILDFARDCDYAVYMVDSLLDLMTGGEHSRTKRQLDEARQLRDEDDAVRQVLETRAAAAAAVRVDIGELRTLQADGIDVGFLDAFGASAAQADLEARLGSMSALLDKLQAIQHRRLSQPLPAHLSHVGGPSDEEVGLAHTITTNLTEIAKKLAPADVVSVAGVRKAMGVQAPTAEGAAAPAQEVDLESELRQFLESENSLHSPMRADDKTIEEILME